MNNPSDSFDLIVIGSGPGGQRAAVQAAKLGKKTLIIERDRLGGACLHKGTIPSKTLREAALGLDAKDPQILTKAFQRAFSVIEAEEAVIRNQLTRNEVKIEIGTASFVDAYTVQIDNGKDKKLVYGQNIVLATGNRSVRPKDVPAGPYFDSDTLFQMKERPKRMLVIGAGVIGCEYASIFSKLGIEVTLIDRRNEILRFIDQEVLSSLVQSFYKAGMEIKLGCQFSYAATQNNKIKIKINDELREFDAAMYCMGRTGNHESLGLEKAGIAVNDRGLINVDACYKTEIDHIYAVGDLQGQPGLATAASEQGRMASASIFQHYCGIFPETFPFGIYTIPEISSVGMHEADLLQKKHPFIVGRAKYSELARGKILGDEEGLLKLIFDKQSKKLIGAHCIGTGATELIHIGQVAMALGADVQFFVSNVFNYPTLAEAYKVAAYQAFNQINS